MDKTSHEETKEKKNKRASGIVGSIKHSIEEAKMKREAPLLDVITFFVAFLFSRCHVVFGSHPLAIAFIAVLPTRVWIAVLGAVSGALTLGKSGIIYSMISVIVVFLRVCGQLILHMMLLFAIKMLCIYLLILAKKFKQRDFLQDIIVMRNFLTIILMKVCII